MAFLAKTDFCGLATTFSSALTLRDDAENKSSAVYAPVDDTGAIFAEEVYGEDSDPTNSYGVKATFANTSTTALKIGAGAITTVANRHYGLESITINTAAGSPVAVSASAKQLEADASSSGRMFVVPEFSFSSAHVAQDGFSAISAFSNCTLTACNHSIACSITKDKVAGVKVSTDANSGLLTISGTVLQKSTADNAATPAITLASGFTLRQFSRTNPESAYPEYAFTITRPLTVYSAA